MSELAVQIPHESNRRLDAIDRVVDGLAAALADLAHIVLDGGAGRVLGLRHRLRPKRNLAGRDLEAPPAEASPLSAAAADGRRPAARAPFFFLLTMIRRPGGHHGLPEPHDDRVATDTGRTAAGWTAQGGQAGLGEPIASVPTRSWSGTGICCANSVNRACHGRTRSPVVSPWPGHLGP